MTRRFLICTALLTAGCTTVHSAPRTTTLDPAELQLRTDRLHDGTDSMRFELLAAQDDSVVRRVDEWRATRAATVAGGAGFMIAYASAAPFNTTDTLAARGDLRPVWELLRTQGRQYDIRYDGRTVRASVRGADGTVHTTTHTFAHVPFGFNELEAVIRSLPLRRGERVVVPLYSEMDDSVEMDTLAVVGRHGSQWDVRFADPVIVEDYELDDRTHEIRFAHAMARRSGRRWRYVYGSPEAPTK